jgi:hypothetical protein
MDATSMIRGLPTYRSARLRYADVTVVAPTSDATPFAFLTTCVQIQRRKTTHDSVPCTKP